MSTLLSSVLFPHSTHPTSSMILDNAPGTQTIHVITSLVGTFVARTKSRVIWLGCNPSLFGSDGEGESRSYVRKVVEKTLGDERDKSLEKGLGNLGVGVESFEYIDVPRMLGVAMLEEEGDDFDVGGFAKGLIERIEGGEEGEVVIVCDDFTEVRQQQKIRSYRSNFGRPVPR